MQALQWLAAAAHPMAAITAIALYLDWRQTRLNIFPRGIYELNRWIRALVAEHGFHGITLWFGGWMSALVAAWLLLVVWQPLAAVFSVLLLVPMVVEVGCVVRNCWLRIWPWR